MMYPGGALLIASATWPSISSISWRICWMYSSREILGVGAMARSSVGKSLTYIDQTAWIAPGKFATHNLGLEPDLSCMAFPQRFIWRWSQKVEINALLEGIATGTLR